MKSKIKKRVERDLNKKNNSGKILLLFILFVLIVGIVYVFINKDILVGNLKKDNEKKKTIEVDNSKYKNVDVNSPNIINLFNLVHAKSSGGDYTIYSNKKLNVSEMEEFYKFALASNLYDGYAVKNSNAAINEITAYIDEDIVKKNYELIFGSGSYKSLEEIPYTCTNMYYDTVNRRYVTTNQACGSISPFSSYEKIISAKKNAEYLLITGAVMFAEGYSGSVCKDYQCKNKIDTYPSNITDKEYFYTYIDKNKDNLMQYTYKFKLGEDGFYYYQGFERTKE